MATLHMMVGIAGCGKSTTAKKFDLPIVSSDSIRAELYGNESIQGDANSVFNEVHRRIREHLANGEDVVYDATNLSAKRRRGFLSQLPKNTIKNAFVIATDIDIILKQNKERKRNVPEEVIMRMYRSFQFPELSEGFDSITVCSHPDNKTSVETELRKCFRFDQENPHHSAFLDQHMSEAESFIRENSNKISKDLVEVTCFAAKVHDIGKLDTKTFLKSNGNIDTIAHYYNHENVGAYKLACMNDHCGFNNDEWEKIIRLVQHHMDGYPFKGDSDYKKVGINYGGEMRAAAQLLHEADINSN